MAVSHSPSLATYVRMLAEYRRTDYLAVARRSSADRRRPRTPFESPEGTGLTYGANTFRGVVPC